VVSICSNVPMVHTVFQKKVFSSPHNQHQHSFQMQVEEEDESVVVDAETILSRWTVRKKECKDILSSQKIFEPLMWVCFLLCMGFGIWSLHDKCDERGTAVLYAGGLGLLDRTCYLKIWKIVKLVFILVLCTAVRVLICDPATEPPELWSMTSSPVSFLAPSQSPTAVLGKEVPIANVTTAPAFLPCKPCTNTPTRSSEKFTGKPQTKWGEALYARFAISGWVLLFLLSLYNCYQMKSSGNDKTFDTIVDNIIHASKKKKRKAKMESVFQTLDAEVDEIKVSGNQVSIRRLDGERIELKKWLLEVFTFRREEQA
jgi:hypothetical protein